MSQNAISRRGFLRRFAAGVTAAAVPPVLLGNDMTGHAREPDRWQPEWIRKKYFGPGK